MVFPYAILITSNLKLSKTASQQRLHRRYERRNLESLESVNDGLIDCYLISDILKSFLGSFSVF